MKIRVYVHCGAVSHEDEIEVDDSEVADLETDEQRSEYLQQYADEFMAGCVDWGFEITVPPERGEEE